jgi:hypothetical protein
VWSKYIQILHLIRSWRLSSHSGVDVLLTWIDSYAPLSDKFYDRVIRFLLVVEVIRRRLGLLHHVRVRTLSQHDPLSSHRIGLVYWKVHIRFRKADRRGNRAGWKRELAFHRFLRLRSIQLLWWSVGNSSIVWFSLTVDTIGSLWLLFALNHLNIIEETQVENLTHIWCEAPHSVILGTGSLNRGDVQWRRGQIVEFHRFLLLIEHGRCHWEVQWGVEAAALV